ncbi:hypothetical protein N7462_002479 [Penicillium macrosclerotiorum]|uniref:uncharacterized protein n=1 Tax=Penicillium macrosclerotiorum TaxID=303699 RepID=UPI0025486F61|nr:uncharacterized protein N7462_002479 [Penicillium macrosclerotiorum]KAJ5693056.1 hypothetical protein N7462_002479 [Penicillium macrosclerotiorum]
MGDYPSPAEILKTHAKPDRAPHLFAFRQLPPHRQEPPSLSLQPLLPTFSPSQHFFTMSGMWHPKKLKIAGFVNTRVIRDFNKRNAFMKMEPERQALRYVIRNTSLPQRVRAKAQLELSEMHCYTRPTQIKNRCVASGTARSVFRDFRLNRFQFRMQALAGELPGVKKASW